MNDIKFYDNLLKLYFSGDSSLEQEVILRKYFTSGNICEMHRKYASFFVYLTNESEKCTQRKKTMVFTIRDFYKLSAAVVIVSVFLFAQYKLPSSKSDFHLIVSGQEFNDKEMAIDVMNSKLEFISSSISRANNSAKNIISDVDYSRPIEQANSLIKFIH